MRSTYSPNFEIFSERTSFIQRKVKLKDVANFFFFLLKKFLYEVSLIRIKEQVGKKRSTVGSHGNVDSLLKNTSSNRNKYVVNQEIKNLDNVSFRDFLVRIRVLFYKV